MEKGDDEDGGQMHRISMTISVVGMLLHDLHWLPVGRIISEIGH